MLDQVADGNSEASFAPKETESNDAVATRHESDSLSTTDPSTSNDSKESDVKDHNESSRDHDTQQESDSGVAHTTTQQQLPQVELDSDQTPSRRASQDSARNLKGEKEDSNLLESSWMKGGKVRTLKDYVDGKPKKSPRGVDLELIKASPREEDLTKIKFARFVFDGVKTSVLSRTVKTLEPSSNDVSPSIHLGKSSQLRLDEQTGTITDVGSQMSEVHATPIALASVNRGSDSAHDISHQVSIEEDIDRLKKLSQMCIEQIGLHVVGQEYTRALKTVCKTLDVALRAGIGDQTLQSKANIASSRWDSVQRLSAILHELHDAEVQLSNNSYIEQLKLENAIWNSESNQGRIDEDEQRLIIFRRQYESEQNIRQRIEAQLREEEHQIHQKAEQDMFKSIEAAIRRQNNEQRLQEHALIREHFRDQEKASMAISGFGKEGLGKESLSRTAPPYNGARRSLMYQESEGVAMKTSRSPRQLLENERVLTPGPAPANNNLRFLF